MSRNEGAPRSGTVSTVQSVRPGAISEALEDTATRTEGGGPPPWSEALRPGAVIGRFQLVREVGKGGFGVVYEALDQELNRAVAFKAVRPGPKQQVRQERLLREAEKAAQLAHPNIVTLHDVGRAEQGPYLVMELLRGATLLRRLHQEPFSLREALRIAIAAASGLAHAHSHGVIHRDLTPGNIFLCDDGQVKLLDLGLAHAFGYRKIDGGTPAYMAPEQRRGAPEDERSDVYALGVILYQMLSGQLPFAPDGRDLAPPPPLELPDRPALAELVERMLRRDPVDRPRDAGEVLDALAEIQEDLERAGQGQTRPDRRPPRRGVGSVSPERTWVCSVVAAEIAGYQEQSVEVQAMWKARFNGQLARSLRDVPEGDRVILDSGSGAAVCFLGDPDAAMSCALRLLRTTGEGGEGADMRVRLGMHLGAVKVLKDINGNLNAVGDGLTVAHRMMAFAGENQILASRSFHDVASCLSDAYRQLFVFGGSRRDEQMHEHEVYELHLPAADARVSGPRSHSGEPAVVTSKPLDAAIGASIENRAATILGPIAHHLARTLSARVSTPRELGEALAAFMPVSDDREDFLRSCSGEPQLAAPAPAASRSLFPPDVLERAGRELAGYVGPLARILVSRTSAKARSEEELYDLLAAEISSEKDREAFRRKGPPTRHFP